MTSIIKTVFGSPNSPTGAMGNKSPSFNDLSMGAHEDANEYVQRQSTEGEEPTPVSPKSPGGVSRTRSKNAWAGVFNPGRNYHDNMKGIGKDYYDHVDKAPGGLSVWDHILKSERQKAFASFDRNADGFITAEDLRLKLGSQADVGQLIAAADKNGDGKIDYAEFCELVRNS